MDGLIISNGIFWVALTVSPPVDLLPPMKSLGKDCPVDLSALLFIPKDPYFWLISNLIWYESKVMGSEIETSCKSWVLLILDKLTPPSSYL